MAAPTDEELEKKREDIGKLQQKLADADAKQAEYVAEQSRVLQMKELEAEEARLTVALESKRESAKKSNVREGAERIANQVDASANAPGTPE
jgi:transposase